MFSLVLEFVYVYITCAQVYIMRCFLPLHKIVKKKLYFWGIFIFPPSRFPLFILRGFQRNKMLEDERKSTKKTTLPKLCVLSSRSFYIVLISLRFWCTIKKKSWVGGFFHSTDFSKLCIMYFFFFCNYSFFKLLFISFLRFFSTISAFSALVLTNFCTSFLHSHPVAFCFQQVLFLFCSRLDS